MTENVISLGDFRITRKRERRYDPKECKHLRTELDDNGEIVTCLDCNKQISAYFALRALAEHWDHIQEDISNKMAHMQREKDKGLHLLAARKVEDAWRSRTMVPTCPHCGEGIQATDGFGGTMVNMVIDEARRAQRRQSRKEQQ